MFGCVNGVQPKPKAECPQSLYVHCCSHVLDTSQQEVATEVNLTAEVLNFVQGVAVIIGESDKRKTFFKSFFGSNVAVKNLINFVQLAGIFVLQL